MNEITINKINQFLDDVIKETSASLDTEFDHAVCHLDDKMTALEELEMKIGQVIVAIDDLRGLIITRKGQVGNDNL